MVGRKQGGGFKYIFCMFVHFFRKLEKWSNLTNIFLVGLKPEKDGGGRKNNVSLEFLCLHGRYCPKLHTFDLRCDRFSKSQECRLLDLGDWILRVLSSKVSRFLQIEQFKKAVSLSTSCLDFVLTPLCLKQAVGWLTRQCLLFPCPHQDVGLQLGKVWSEVLPQWCFVWRHLLLHHTWCFVPCGCCEDPHPAGPCQISGWFAECWQASRGRRRCCCADHRLGTDRRRLLCPGLVQVRWQWVFQDPLHPVFGWSEGLGHEDTYHAWCFCLRGVHRGYLPVPLGSSPNSSGVWPNLSQGHLYRHEGVGRQRGDHGLVRWPCSNSVQADPLHHGKVCSSGKHRDFHLQCLADQKREHEPHFQDGCFCHFWLHCGSGCSHHFTPCRLTAFKDQQEGCRRRWWNALAPGKHCQRDWLCEALHHWSWTKVHHDWHPDSRTVLDFWQFDAVHGSWEVPFPRSFEASLSNGDVKLNETVRNPSALPNGQTGKCILRERSWVEIKDWTGQKGKISILDIFLKFELYIILSYSYNIYVLSINY